MGLRSFLRSTLAVARWVGSFICMFRVLMTGKTSFKAGACQFINLRIRAFRDLRDMTVLDPDGNKFRFCTRLEDWKRASPR